MEKFSCGNELESRLQALEERVAQLETSIPETSSNPPLDSNAGEKFWAIEKLASEDIPNGSVIFAGISRLPSGEEVSYQWQRTTDFLRTSEWDAHFARLAAISHPIRGKIVQRLLHGPMSIHKFVEEEIVSSIGAAYHHCGELEKASWIIKEGKGIYRLDPTRIIPLLTIIAATEGH